MPVLFEAMIAKSMAPTYAWPIYTKRTGALSMTLLNIVITMASRKTVKMPIRTASGRLL